MSNDQASSDDRQREREADAVETKTDYMDATEFSIWEYIRDETGCSLEKLQISEIIRIAQRIPVSETADQPSPSPNCPDPLPVKPNESWEEYHSRNTAKWMAMEDARQSDTPSITNNYADCPRTTAAMRKGYDCKVDHFYTTADFSDSLERELSAVTAERDKARAALREHGAHADNCATNAMSIRGTRCTCGFIAALEESK